GAALAQGRDARVLGVGVGVVGRPGIIYLPLLNVAAVVVGIGLVRRHLHRVATQPLKQHGQIEALVAGVDVEAERRFGVAIANNRAVVGSVHFAIGHAVGAADILEADGTRLARNGLRGVGCYVGRVAEQAVGLVAVDNVERLAHKESRNYRLQIAGYLNDLLLVVGEIGRHGQAEAAGAQVVSQAGFQAAVANRAGVHDGRIQAQRPRHGHAVENVLGRALVHVERAAELALPETEIQADITRGGGFPLDVGVGRRVHGRARRDGAAKIVA
nr:hypothetical protein [Tanacetum cinerariifolium]